MKKPKLTISPSGERAVIKKQGCILVEFKYDFKREAFDINFKNPDIEKEWISTVEGKSFLEQVLKELYTYIAKVETLKFWKSSAESYINHLLKKDLN